MSDRGSREIAVAAAVAVGARLLFHLLTDFTFDDAFITYRYAENLAAGHGFVYNLGERVLGTTTPLHTVLLAALALVRVPAPVGSLLLSIAASGVTAAVAYRYAQRLGFDRYSLLPALVYAVFSRLLPTDSGGMETALFTMLVVAAFYCHCYGSAAASAAFASLAALTRPEGLLVLAIILSHNVLHRRVRVFLQIGLAAAVLLPWAIFAVIYFGSPIPSSITAKLALYGRVWAEPPLQNLIFVMGWHNPLGWALFLLALPGGWWLVRRRKSFGLEILWIALTIVGLVFSGTKIFRWYISPFYPFYIVCAAATVLPVREWLARLHTRSTNRLALSLLHLLSPRLVIPAVTIVLLVMNWPSVRYYDYEWRELHGIHMGVADYITAHGSPSDLVATEDIGEVGHSLPNRILDRAGLVTPAAIAHNRTGDYFGLIREFGPEWVVISPRDPTAGFLQSPSFDSLYEFRETFLPLSEDSWGFDLYRRR